MPRPIGSFLRAGSLIALAPMLALSACNKAVDQTNGNSMAMADNAAAPLPALPATLPLSTGPARPISYAPGASELPDTRALPVARVREPRARYAYADQAYGFTRALGDAPPDYAFDYDGVSPWAWQGYDDSVSYAEPIDGGYRYYYYRPGADTPYFIRDPYYGYGYDDGRLSVVYAADGAIVPYEDYGPMLGYASRYWVRAGDLWRAAHDRPRRPVIATVWEEQRTVITDTRERWFSDRDRQPDWMAYHQQYASQQDSHWQPEDVRREADARRYQQWQAQSFETPPPPRAIPVRWQQASWARDPSRFAPAAAAVAAAGVGAAALTRWGRPHDAPGAGPQGVGPGPAPGMGPDQRARFVAEQQQRQQQAAGARVAQQQQVQAQEQQRLAHREQAQALRQQQQAQLAQRNAARAQEMAAQRQAGAARQAAARDEQRALHQQQAAHQQQVSAQHQQAAAEQQARRAQAAQARQAAQADRQAERRAAAQAGNAQRDAARQQADQRRAEMQAQAGARREEQAAAHQQQQAARAEQQAARQQQAAAHQAQQAAARPPQSPRMDAPRPQSGGGAPHGGGAPRGGEHGPREHR